MIGRAGSNAVPGMTPSGNWGASGFAPFAYGLRGGGPGGGGIGRPPVGLFVVGPVGPPSGRVSPGPP